MTAKALSHFPSVWMTCVALVLFFTVFVGWLTHVLRPANRAHFRRMETLPLEDNRNE